MDKTGTKPKLNLDIDIEIDNDIDIDIELILFPKVNNIFRNYVLRNIIREAKTLRFGERGEGIGIRVRGKGTKTQLNKVAFGKRNVRRLLFGDGPRYWEWGRLIWVWFKVPRGIGRGGNMWGVESTPGRVKEGCVMDLDRVLLWDAGRVVSWDWV